ncbi:MAG: hypothetical protein ACJAZI_000043 [Cycloclasticus sp.]|jgi:hypothetical protein
MNTSEEEKRRFKRIFHDAYISLITPDELSIPCQLLDISLNGCLVEGDSETKFLRVDDALKLEIILHEDLIVGTSAHIIFVGEGGQIGLQFDDIEIDSITSLRRLVELNMGDSTMLERNLHALSALRVAKLP